MTNRLLIYIRRQRNMNFIWDYSLQCKPNGQRPKQYIAEAAHDQEVCRLRDVEKDGLTTDNLKGVFKGAH